MQPTIGSQSPASSTTSKKDTTSDTSRPSWGSTSALWDPAASISSDNANPWENGEGGWGSSASTWGTNGATWGKADATWGTNSTDNSMDVDPAPTTSTSDSRWGASSSKDTSPWGPTTSSSSSAKNTSQAASSSMDTSWGGPSSSINDSSWGAPPTPANGASWGDSSHDSSWGQPKASTSTLNAPSWSTATVEHMQVDSIAPSTVDKGKGKEVDCNPSSHAVGSKPSLPHRKPSSNLPENTDSPIPTRVQDTNRQRSPSHTGSDNSTSTVSTIPTNPQDIHLQWIKYFIFTQCYVRILIIHFLGPFFVY